MNIIPPSALDKEMAITRWPTKIKCSQSPRSLLSKTQDEALNVGHGCNPQNNVHIVLQVLFEPFSQNVFHFNLFLSHLMNWRTGCY